MTIPIRGDGIVGSYQSWLELLLEDIMVVISDVINAIVSADNRNYKLNN